MSDIKYLPKILLGIPNYLKQKNLSKPIILGMAMQVKNEVDIIELNIRYHALKGVSKFYVMDNNSQDGTWELLKKLQKNYDITLFKDITLDYNQANNMTYLSEIAYKQDVDFCIQNDADEFWYPASGSLLTNLSREQTVLRVKRVNNLPLLNDENNYIFSPWVTNNVVRFDFSGDSSAKEVNFLHHNVLHKVMTNLHGLIAISGGNHGAKHCWDKLKGQNFSNWNHNILIFHHALRDYKQFEIKARTVSEALCYSKKKGNKKHNFGIQAVAWAQDFEKGKLKDTYNNMLLDPNHIDALEKLQIIAYDDRLVNDFKSLNLIA